MLQDEIQQRDYQITKLQEQIASLKKLMQLDADGVDNDSKSAAGSVQSIRNSHRTL